MLDYKRFGNEVKKRKFKSLKRYSVTVSGQLRCWMVCTVDGNEFSVPMTLLDSIGDPNLTKLSKQVSDSYKWKKVRRVLEPFVNPPRIQLESNSNPTRIQLESSSNSTRIQLESNSNPTRIQLESNLNPDAESW